MNTRAIDVIVLSLIIIGAVNWGLIGFFRFDLIASIFGGTYAAGSRIIYALVGLAALYGITFYNRLRSEI